TTQLVDLADRLAEIHIDRIDLLDAREQGRFTLADERAFSDLLLARASADRSRDVGVAEVDLGALDIRLRLLDRCRGGAFGGFGIVRVGLRQQPLARDRAGALGS